LYSTFAPAKKPSRLIVWPVDVAVMLVLVFESVKMSFTMNWLPAAPSA